MDLFQPLDWLAPHAHIVYNQDLVERLLERRKMFDRTATQIHTTRVYGICVALGCLPNHDFRVIDATHKTLCRAAAQLSDRDPRSEANLKDAIGWLHF
uniref:hypothetical protein n=1 Tax=Leptolyngbya sp. NIES-2104 TaxID=1552121 RepID=UPI0021F15D81|nr:hypothetical protein [Leptolyngbya sp. NIES-2104]